MTTINSVLGPLDTAKLGFTLMHEHLVISSTAAITQTYTELLGADFMERVVDELNRAKEGGITTILDATTFDLGRDVRVLAEASRRTRRQCHRHHRLVDRCTTPSSRRLD